MTAFETVHDMGLPVASLAWMRELLVEGGVVLVADERVGETFTAPGDAIERLNYGFSALHCLPATIAESDEAATGTVMRPPTLRRYAQEAGFRQSRSRRSITISGGSTCCVPDGAARGAGRATRRKALVAHPAP